MVIIESDNKINKDKGKRENTDVKAVRLMAYIFTFNP
jgi:hypothetical protein